MELQRINVKFFMAEPDRAPLADFIAIFHSWIQSADGIYYDVADYSHMAAGPGIVLVAHEANISVDETGGRRGLLYNQKQPLKGSNQERLRLVFRSALENCRRIEEEPKLGRRSRFRGEEALLIINDRLLAPNTEETFSSLRPDLEDFLRRLYRGADFSLERDTEPRKRFSVGVKAAVRFEMADLLKNLWEQA